MGLMTAPGRLGRDPAGSLQLRAAAARRRAVPGAVPEAGAGRGRRRDDRRQPANVAALRVGPPAGLLLPAGGRAGGRARAVRPAHALPEEGRGVVLHDPRRRPSGGERRVVLPGAARGRGPDHGTDRLLLRPDGPLVRGGRGDRRPPARSLPPGRRAPELPPRPRLAGRRGAGRDRSGDGAVRVQPADPLVHPARGRDRRARAHRHRRPAAPTRGWPSYYAVQRGTARRSRT